MEMCRIIPAGACPNCGKGQFVVINKSMNVYLTNRNGEVIDCREYYDGYIGKCCTCGKEYPMMPTYNGFVPMTRLRQLVWDFVQPDIPEIENPMRRKKNESKSKV